MNATFHLRYKRFVSGRRNDAPMPWRRTLALVGAFVLAVFGVVVTSVAGPGTARANGVGCTRAWIAGPGFFSPSDWDNPGSWQDGQQPESGDTVCVDGGGTVTWAN